MNTEIVMEVDGHRKPYKIGVEEAFSKHLCKRCMCRRSSTSCKSVHHLTVSTCFDRYGNFSYECNGFRGKDERRREVPSRGQRIKAWFGGLFK